jgi:DNA-binding transcriptional ArsR family regulator
MMYGRGKERLMEHIPALDEASSVVTPLEISKESGGTETMLATSDAELYARFFQVLSDPTRVRLVHLLLEAPETGRTVSELVAAIGAPQGRVSTHLGCLRWCGFVHPCREGKYVYYRIADPRVGELLRIGGAMMRDHAAGIASCGVIR